MSSPAERIDKAADAARGPLRFVSAASLFDGHDAAINIIRRILQSHGAEVVHLGTQPQRRRHRSRRDPGRRRRRRRQQLPGRPQRVFPLHGGHAPRAGRGPRESRRRRRRHDRGARGRGARGLRCRKDLHAGRRPAARPRRHDRRRLPPGARDAAAVIRGRPGSRGRPGESRARDHAPRAGRRRERRFARPEPRREDAQPPAGPRDHGHGRRRQVVADRRDPEPHRPVLPGPARRRGRHGSRRGADRAARCSATGSE